MARGDKSAYTTRQKRKARHIEESYEERGVGEKEAAARAWATVNKQSGGGEKSGSGRRKPASQKAAARRDSARRAVATKEGHSPNRGRASARKRGAARRSPDTRASGTRPGAKRSTAKRARLPGGRASVPDGVAQDNGDPPHRRRAWAGTCAQPGLS